MAFPLEKTLAVLEKETASYDVPVVDLIGVQTKDPYKVLVATILSARTRDEVTAIAAERLFRKADNLRELAGLELEEIENLVRSVGFFRNKAKYLKKLPLVIEEEFGGNIPQTIDELVKLPGVGRKTANLVVSVAFNRPAICVDTHVHRIMNIWGVVKTDNPLQTEMALRKIVAEKYWSQINRLLVAFGQGTCTPRSPHCDRCVLVDKCPQIGVVPRKNIGLKKMSKEEKQESKTNTGRFLVSWNVNGLRAAHKKGFLNSFYELDADVFCLQEIKATPEQLPKELLNIDGYHAYWCPAEKKGYSGVAIYTKEEPVDVIYGLEQKEFDSEGRCLTLEFADYYLLNCYFPNAQPGLRRIDYKLAFNRAVMNLLERLAEKKSVVLCGDLNVAHREIDLANPEANRKNPGFSDAEREWMNEIIDRAGFVDSFRLFNSEPGNYSWWSYRFNARARNIGWRIDYFVTDPGSRNRVKAAAIHDDITGSDHCPVSMVFL